MQPSSLPACVLKKARVQSSQHPYRACVFSAFLAHRSSRSMMKWKLLTKAEKAAEKFKSMRRTASNVW
ncbi:hypothetical protein NL676_031226 [Syzygium grande]|nr:hypothetical protein NL676_031226 [Syzygium grande]